MTRMKRKVAGRLFGLASVGFYTAVGYGYYHITKGDPVIRPSLERLLIAPFALFLISDGITDLIRGTHHYFAGRALGLMGSKKFEEVAKRQDVAGYLERELPFE